MSKKIIVAGCGHGGLVAAAILGRNGYDVTVYENKQPEELGHDWEDRFTFSLLSDFVGIKLEDIPGDVWRYRGDCAFVSPNRETKVVINYTDENRQKVMWRKPIISTLIDYARRCNVKFEFGVNILGPVILGSACVGIQTDQGEKDGELVIDACGAFSPIRMNLPEGFEIEKEPKRGDVFYAYRAYFENTTGKVPDVPFEVALYQDGEQGLGWVNVNKESVDVLIGRIDKLPQELLDYRLKELRQRYPYMGDKILHGGNFGIIPVRRPLTRMVANGYAAVGDSAFMTTPMNGMGIDLSIQAGKLLAETVLKDIEGKYTINSLWPYNREYHIRFGGDTAKNDGLKNSILQLPSEGVDFLFKEGVIQASDLSGAGRNTKLSALLGKFVRGMKNPKYFFAILKGLIKGAKQSKKYKSAPLRYNKVEVDNWDKAVKDASLEVTRVVPLKIE